MMRQCSFMPTTTHPRFCAVFGASSARLRSQTPAGSSGDHLDAGQGVAVADRRIPATCRKGLIHRPLQRQRSFAEPRIAPAAIHRSAQKWRPSAQRGQG